MGSMPYSNISFIGKVARKAINVLARRATTFIYQSMIGNRKKKKKIISTVVENPGDLQLQRGICDNFDRNRETDYLP